RRPGGRPVRRAALRRHAVRWHPGRLRARRLSRATGGEVRVAARGGDRAGERVAASRRALVPPRRHAPPRVRRRRPPAGRRGGVRSSPRSAPPPLVPHDGPLPNTGQNPTHVTPVTDVASVNYAE